MGTESSASFGQFASRRIKNRVGAQLATIFIRAIPYNYYAILTVVMMVCMVLMKTEFGKMKTHERNAAKGGFFAGVDFVTAFSNSDAFL